MAVSCREQRLPALAVPGYRPFELAGLPSWAEMLEEETPSDAVALAGRIMRRSRSWSGYRSQNARHDPSLQVAIALAVCLAEGGVEADPRQAAGAAWQGRRSLPTEKGAQSPATSSGGTEATPTSIGTPFADYESDEADDQDAYDDPPPEYAFGVQEDPAADPDIDAPRDTEAVTTLMIRNVATNWSRRALLNAIEGLGFDGLYDFAHLPMAFGSGRNKGFAFLNFKDEETAMAFARKFDGSSEEELHRGAHLAWRVSRAEVQGYRANAAAANTKKMNRIRKRRYKPLLMPKAPGAADAAGAEDADHHAAGP